MRKAIIFAIIVSTIYFSHNIFMPFFLEGKYSPETTTFYEVDRSAYIPRYTSAYQELKLQGDVSLAEYDNAPVVYSVLTRIVYAGLGFAVGSMEIAFMISDFLFPFAIFLLMYLLIYEFTNNKILSLTVSSIFIFAPQLSIHLPPISLAGLKQIFIDLSVPFTDLQFHRLGYPRATFMFSVLSYLLIFRSLFKNKSIWLAGISFGLLFYTYLYDWVYLFVGIITTAILFLFFDKSISKKLAQIFGIGLLVSIPYWLNYISLTQLAHYNDIILRTGMEVGRHFNLHEIKNYIRVLGIIALIWIVIKKDKRVIYLTGFLLPYFALTNMQLITGFNPIADHWTRQLYIPITLAFAILFVRFFKLNKIVVFILLFFFGLQLYGQFMHSKTNAHFFEMTPSEVEAYNWLNNNTEPNSVVGTFPLKRNTDVLVHTHNKVFIPSHYNTVAPSNEISDRFVILNKIFRQEPHYTTDDFFYMFGELAGIGIQDIDYNPYRLDYLLSEKTLPFDLLYENKEFKIYGIRI